MVTFSHFNDPIIIISEMTISFVLSYHLAILSSIILKSKLIINCSILVRLRNDDFKCILPYQFLYHVSTKYERTKKP